MKEYVRERKIMNVKKIIHEELGRNLEEIGFEYFQEEHQRQAGF